MKVPHSALRLHRIADGRYGNIHLEQQGDRCHAATTDGAMLACCSWPAANGDSVTVNIHRDAARAHCKHTSKNQPAEVSYEGGFVELDAPKGHTRAHNSRFPEDWHDHFPDDQSEVAHYKFDARRLHRILGALLEHVDDKKEDLVEVRMSLHEGGKESGIKISLTNLSAPDQDRRVGYSATGVLLSRK